MSVEAGIEMIPRNLPLGQELTENAACGSKTWI